MRGAAAYEDHMCHKMDGAAEKSGQMWSVSPLIVIMTHNRDAEERAVQSASVIIICNHVTPQRHSNPLPHSSRLFKHKLVIVTAIQMSVVLVTSGRQIIWAGIIP